VTDTTEYRSLVALPRGGGKVYVGWRLLADAAAGQAFHVLRRRPGGAWEQATTEPVTGSTNWVDRPPTAGVYEYRIRTGGRTSEAVTVDSSLPATNVALSIPLRVPGRECGRVCVDDLDGDGRMDFVVLGKQGGHIVLDAFRGDGAPLWRIDTGLPARGGWDGGTLHCPFLIWDVNGDGRAEVVYHRQPGNASYPEDFYGEAQPGETVAVADGETGELLWEAPWPATRPRVMMNVGHLRGVDEAPAIIVLDGTYGDVVLTALDGRDGAPLWQVRQSRPAGHNLDVSDIDEDGIQEVICGGICYNGDGTVRWEAEDFGHTDISKPAYIDPELPGKQILYAVESGNPGAYLVDNQGRTIFKEPFQHAHFGWIARHTTEHLGLQMHVAQDARRGMRELEHNPVFLPDGSHWLDLTDWQRKNFVPVQWDEGPVTVFIVRKENRLVRLLPTGEVEPVPPGGLPPGGRYDGPVRCDILGDYREEIVAIDSEEDRLIVLTNTEPASRRGCSPMDDFDYHHDRSQVGSGYYRYLASPLTAL